MSRYPSYRFSADNNGGSGCAPIIQLILVIGWVVNLVQFAKCDFEEPYKTEIIRAVGICTGPVGSVMGFLTPFGVLDDEKPTDIEYNENETNQ